MKIILSILITTLTVILFQKSYVLAGPGNKPNVSWGASDSWANITSDSFYSNNNVNITRPETYLKVSSDNGTYYIPLYK